MQPIGILRVETPADPVQVKEYPVDFVDASLGRRPGNHVVVDHPSVARRHARLMVRGADLLIEDLSSNTGTYVNNESIAPNVPVVVPRGAFLKFGDAAGHFRHSSDVPPGSLLAHQTESDLAPPTNRPPAAEKERWLSVKLRPPESPIRPGAAGTTGVEVQYRGPLVIDATVRVEGIPHQWIQIARPTLHLMPGARVDFHVVITLPDSSRLSAGVHSFTLIVSIPAHDVEFQSIGSFEIPALEDLSATLRPLRGTGSYSVILTNLGTTTARVRLDGEDDEDILEFHSAPSMSIEHHDSREMRLTVRPRKRSHFGRAIVTPFRVHIQTTTDSAPVSLRVSGTNVFHPPMQRWAGPLLWLSVLAILGSFGMVGLRVFSPSLNSFQQSFGLNEDRPSTDFPPTPTEPVLKPTPAQEEASNTTPVAAFSLTPATSQTALVSASPATLPAVPTVGVISTPSTSPLSPQPALPVRAAITRTTTESLRTEQASNQQITELFCPPGMLLANVEAGTGEYSASAPNVLASLRIWCRNIRVGPNKVLTLESGGSIYEINKPAPTKVEHSIFKGRATVESACPSSALAHSIDIRYGSVVDSLRVNCIAMTTSGSWGDSKPSGTLVGGPGGAKSRILSCKPGDFAIGIGTNPRTDGVYILNLICGMIGVGSEYSTRKDDLSTDNCVSLLNGISEATGRKVNAADLRLVNHTLTIGCANLSTFTKLTIPP